MKYNTISQMFYNTVSNNLDKELYYYKNSSEWVPLTGKDILNTVSSIAIALKYRGINTQDKVSILSTTTYRWALCDYGIITMGGVTTTIYPTLLPEQICHIINDSDSKLIFVENNMQLERVKSIYNDCPKLKYIIVMDNSQENDEEFVLNLNSFLIVPEDFILDKSNDYLKLVNTATPDDLLTLIYTSGTTGTPKGVMLTHKNLIANIKATSMLIPDFRNETFLSFLPISHVLERMGGQFFPFSLGSKIYFAESMEKVGENMLESKPTIVVCVPRFFEKMYDKIIQGVNEAPSVKKKLFAWSIKVGKDYTHISSAGYKIPSFLKFKRSIAKKLVYDKLKMKFGNNIKYFISGGAPLSRDIAEFFASLDITILEGYGLTETSPVLCSNVPGKVKFGTVGFPLSNVEIKIANDGEILAKGPNVMVGYYKKEKETQEVFDEDGWFKTGDIGEIDKAGYLKITDRKKSLIVTSAGKNIAPAPLENALNSSDYIDQSIIIGDQKNYITALIVPAFDNLAKYLAKNEIEITSNEAMIEHHSVIELFESEISTIMQKFAKYEQVKKFKLLSRQFSIDRGEMTPKMSIVRKVVINNFKEKIDSLYNDN